MKTIEEFREFYATDLLADLQVLEQQRKKVASRLMIAAAVIFGLAAIVAFIFIAVSREPGFVIFAIIIAAIAFIFVCKAMTKGYVSDFKAGLIRKIVHFIDEHLSYEPERCIPRSVFMDSKIFHTRPNRYKGDDLVSGRIGSTKLRFSELDAVHESGSGKNRSRVTIFKGLFFIADFNKNFRTETIVLPDTAEKLFGWLGEKLQSMNVFRDQLIKLEDVEFEKHFVVYGADQIEARYILSPSLMKRIVDFKEKTGRKIYLSFVGSMVFVAIWIDRPLFEPRLFSTLLDFAPVRQYFEDLQLAIGIVDDLNLNTRIWSKQ